MKFVWGLFFTGKKHISRHEKIGKSDFTPSEKYLSTPLAGGLGICLAHRRLGGSIPALAHYPIFSVRVFAVWELIYVV